MHNNPVSFVIEHSLPGQRLDTYLRERYPDMSRGAWQRLIEEGAVRVNDRVVKCTLAPKQGAVVSIHWPTPQPATALPEAISLNVLYEDDDLLVLNKASGMVVHPAAGHTEHTLVHALLHHCAGQLSGIGGVARPGIVHRLDKDTSGCLVVAKNDASHLSLAGQFASRKVVKIYHALVCGQVTSERGEIRAAVARHPSHRKRMAVASGGGREAWTTYQVLERWRATTLVAAQLHTGRTHQIRVHFQHQGHPLVGDITYGKRPNQHWAEETGLTSARVMLHAHRLAFSHPRSSLPIDCTAPWPQDFQELTDQLRQLTVT
jgi:23S rRNA pseudouridine1911/1915/1917 synthase